MQSIKAVIFDWARTLYDRETNKEFPEAAEILQYCQNKGYRLATVSLVTPLNSPGQTAETRRAEIENSPLRKYFEVALTTDADKDKLFDEISAKFGLPRGQVLIVDDRTVRGIRYGSRHGHPTVWLEKGKYAYEKPNAETGQPTHTIQELRELKQIV